MSAFLEGWHTAAIDKWYEQHRTWWATWIVYSTYRVCQLSNVGKLSVHNYHLTLMPPAYMTTKLHQKSEIAPYLGNGKACMHTAFSIGLSTKFGINRVISRRLPIVPEQKWSSTLRKWPPFLCKYFWGKQQLWCPFQGYRSMEHALRNSLIGNVSMLRLILCPFSKANSIAALFHCYYTRYKYRMIYMSIGSSNW